MKGLSIIILFLSSMSFSHAQLSGTVSNEVGELLAFVNIYVKNTTQGTSSNYDGAYALNLDPGTYDIVYQYVGYETRTISVTLSKTGLKEDVVMQEQKYQLDEIVIAADAEDPAYDIIRKAQAKRGYYKDLLDDYKCDVYVRGFNKVQDAPERIMGIEVGDMEGMLDTNRQGIVYLSESISRLYYKDGKRKEIMHSSKVSGDDRGYSFNSAREMDFSFYENRLELNRQLVSPIASSAMSHYDYSLEGITYGEEGSVVNKIRVIPKNKYGNVFFGHIYINDDLWNIHSIDLYASKEATQLPFIDSLNFKQLYTPVSKDKWVLFSNVIKFQMSVFGINFGGNFVAVYTDYQFNDIDDAIFNSEVYKVLEDSNEHDERYWDSIRPIPLTQEERVDYITKDSIRIVRQSPAYLDSLDRRANRFTFSDVFLGYSHQNSLKKTSLSFDAPIKVFGLNTIQGWNSAVRLRYRKYLNEPETISYRASAKMSYGLSEKVFRPSVNLQFRDRRYNNTTYRIAGGKALVQFNRHQPISRLVNSLFTWIPKENYLKAYDKNFIALSMARDLGVAFRFRSSIDYEDRSAVINQYKIGDPNYTSNNPQLSSEDAPAFMDHQAFIFRASLGFQFGKEVWSYPHRTFKSASDWPVINVYYKAGVQAFGADVKYHLLYSTLFKNLDVGIFGNSTLYAMGGGFLGQTPEFFADYVHFTGNQTHIGNSTEYYYQFLLMPYYDNSTNENFLQIHFQHKFNGFLLSKIPLLKRSNFQLVAGYKYLNTSTSELYDEFHIGFDNLGIGIARIFRIDLVWASRRCGPLEDCDDSKSLGIVLGSSITF